MSLQHCDFHNRVFDSDHSTMCPVCASPALAGGGEPYDPPKDDPGPQPPPATEEPEQAPVEPPLLPRTIPSEAASAELADTLLRDAAALVVKHRQMPAVERVPAFQTSQVLEAWKGSSAALERRMVELEPLVARAARLQLTLFGILAQEAQRLNYITAALRHLEPADRAHMATEMRGLQLAALGVHELIAQDELEALQAAE